MVDSINGAGSVQNLQSNRSQQAVERREERQETTRTEARDEVQLSEEAISLAQAEQVANQVSVALAQDSSQSLGLDPSFDEAV